jgi:hypothetical protein
MSLREQVGFPATRLRHGIYQLQSECGRLGPEVLCVVAVPFLYSVAADAVIRTQPQPGDKWSSVRHRVVSQPASLTMVVAVITSTPSRRVKSAPVRVPLRSLSEHRSRAEWRRVGDGMGLKEERNTFRKKRFAAAASRLPVSRKSIVCPVESTARYRYFS